MFHVKHCRSHSPGLRLHPSIWYNARQEALQPERTPSRMKTEHMHQLPAGVTIEGKELSIAQVLAVSRHNAPVTLGNDSIQRIQAARAVIDTIAAEDRIVYGITTGFGHLSSVHIPHEQQIELQYNLLRSTAAGVGEPLSEEVVRAMMLLLAASLSRGNSGARIEVIQTLLGMLNGSIYPIIPSRGSVGASGDLAPLAHLGLVLIGEGEAFHNGHRCSGARALQEVGLVPLRLHAKEGLALINGTHLMEAIAVLALADAQALIRTAEVACAMSIEGLMGSHVPLDPRIHQARGQRGQHISAARLLKLVSDSEINDSHRNCARVQDPYTLRCAPQVLGAVRDALEYCASIFERELSAVTDNPLVFPEDGAPLFLTPNPGLNSGFMVAQYVAAALVNEIKVLAHPASIDSIPTCAGMEDFVSMGVTSAHKLRQIVEQAQQVIAIELLCAAQMLDFRKPLKPGAGVQRAFELVRSYVPKLERDRVLAPDIAKIAEAIKDGVFDVVE